MNKILRDFLLLIGIFGGIWAGIAYLPILWEAPDLTLSKEQEQKLGDVLAKDVVLDKWENVSQQYPLADSALRVIYTRLLGSIPEPAYNYKFYILRDSTVNAFTIAGGHIFVFEGLIQFCESPEELAAVLAHEIGHSQKRHVVKKLTKDLGLELVSVIISGGNETVVHEAGKLLFSSRYDRTYEKQADRFAVDLLEKANINPYTMAGFFRRLKEKDMAYDEDLEFIMTHPHNDSRIRDILTYQTAASFTQKPFTIDWKAVQQSLAN